MVNFAADSIHPSRGWVHINHTRRCNFLFSFKSFLFYNAFGIRTALKCLKFMLQGTQFDFRPSHWQTWISFFCKTLVKIVPFRRPVNYFLDSWYERVDNTQFDPRHGSCKIFFFSQKFYANFIWYPKSNIRKYPFDRRFNNSRNIWRKRNWKSWNNNLYIVAEATKREQNVCWYCLSSLK